MSACPSANKINSATVDGRKNCCIRLEVTKGTPILKQKNMDLKVKNHHFGGKFKDGSMYDNILTILSIIVTHKEESKITSLEE